ncbi:hypothetical protein CAT7_06221 [Carnobacterium sp. AT7]|nr:hypothetical protein CAT7_06221 [Carnobacterium sp. AT7]
MAKDGQNLLYDYIVVAFVIGDMDR